MFTGPTTVHWSPKEASLGRDSFNAMVRSRGGKLDVTEAMMKAAVIGRASEIEGYEPPGMVSRKIAEVLTANRSAGPAGKIQTIERKKMPTENPPLPAAPSARASARSMYTPEVERVQWGTMLRRPSEASMATATLRSEGERSPLPAAGSCMARSSSVPLHPPSGAEGATATKHWGPKEHALNRDSFNAIARHVKLDVTEVMMRDAMMSKSAMEGPGWEPPGIVSRKIAEILTKQA